MVEAGASKYTWRQAGDEIDVDFPVDAEVNTKAVKCVFGLQKINLQVNGETLFDGELCGVIDPEESSWSLEGKGEKRKVVINLAKGSKTWPALSLEEAKESSKDFEVVGLEDVSERVETNEKLEVELEIKFNNLKKEKGIEHVDTLDCFFELFDNCIQLYRLNKMSNYLATIVPHCRTRTDRFKLKAIQALGFVRWKQNEFQEALGLFHEMEDMLGKNAALCENIAHTYNSLGNYPKAEEYFRDALKFIESTAGSNQGNRGGVLLGLGLVRDRLGQIDEALPVVEQAYEFYKEKARGTPSSLQAKAGMSCAKILGKLDRHREAERYVREAVSMYEVTCGEESPLTASAYQELGEVLWRQGKAKPAQNAMKRAYEIEAKKDAFNLLSILEIHNLLMDTHLKDKDKIDRSSFEPYFDIAEYTIKRVRDLPQDGNAAVYYKAAAELFCWGGNYQRAFELFEEAIGMLKIEKSVDTSSLIESCQVMRDFCCRNITGSQESPMVLNVKDGERGGDKGGYPDKKERRKIEKKLAKEIAKEASKVAKEEQALQESSQDSADTPGAGSSGGAASSSSSKPMKKLPMPKITASSTHKVNFVRQFAKDNGFNNADVTRWLIHVTQMRKNYGLPPGDYIDELVVRLSENNGPEHVAAAIRRFTAN